MLNQLYNWMVFKAAAPQHGWFDTKYDGGPQPYVGSPHSNPGLSLGQPLGRDPTGAHGVLWGGSDDFCWIQSCGAIKYPQFGYGAKFIFHVFGYGPKTFFYGTFSELGAYYWVKFTFTACMFSRDVWLILGMAIRHNSKSKQSKQIDHQTAQCPNVKFHCQLSSHSKILLPSLQQLCFYASLHSWTLMETYGHFGKQTRNQNIINNQFPFIGKQTHHFYRSLPLRFDTFSGQRTNGPRSLPWCCSSWAFGPRSSG